MRGCALGVAVIALAVATPAAAEGPGGPPGAAQRAIAYVTQTAVSPAVVWAARSDGREAIRLGPGAQPLIAPGGRLVAASLFAFGAEPETGPALAVYSTAGGAPATYLNLASGSATALAWSPDGRYVAVNVQSTAVTNAAAKSGLAVVDTALNKLTMLATGEISGASFAPDGSDRLVYARAPSQSLSARVNLFVTTVTGQPQTPGGAGALTGDGRSLNPVWGARGIAYDRERLRRNQAPQYQIWLLDPVTRRAHRLTNVAVGPLVSGLVPLAFSGDGTRLLAEYEGQDTSEAWTVRVSPARARRLTVRGRAMEGAGISRDGRTLLVEAGGFGEPASNGRVATIPFAGGRAKVIVAHGAQASWDR